MLLLTHLCRTAIVETLIRCFLKAGIPENTGEIRYYPACPSSLARCCGSHDAVVDPHLLTLPSSTCEALVFTILHASVEEEPEFSSTRGASESPPGAAPLPQQCLQK